MVRAYFSFAIAAALFLALAAGSYDSGLLQTEENLGDIDNPFVPLTPKNIVPVNGTGPLPLEILSVNPRLAYLGTFNKKAFYIERTKLSYHSSENFCTSNGMQLASFVDAAEQLAVYGMIPSSDGNVWTSAFLKMSGLASTNFMWTPSNTTLYSAKIYFYYDQLPALVLIVDSSSNAANGLVVASSDGLHNVLCYI